MRANAVKTWLASVASLKGELVLYKQLQASSSEADAALRELRRAITTAISWTPTAKTTRAEWIAQAEAYDAAKPSFDPKFAMRRRLEAAFTRGDLLAELLDKESFRVRAAREAVTAAEEGADHGVPLIQRHVLDSAMKRTEEQVKLDADTALVAGTEFLGTVAVSGFEPVGAALFTTPISPSLLGGGRLSVIAKTFELYCPIKVVFEYQFYVSAVSAGAVVGFCEPDVMNNNALNPGNTVIRDAMSRPGAEAAQIWERSAFALSFDQQAWYYCSNNESPNLSIAALFSLIGMSVPAAGTIGCILMHYEFEFRQSTTFQAASAAVRNVADTTANFNSHTETLNQSFFVVAANFLTMAPGEIGCAVVKTVNDGATAASWRNVLVGENRSALTVVVGTRLFFRRDPSGINITFYPSFGAATLGFNSATDPGLSVENLVNAQTTVIGAAAGTNLVFEQITIWQLPADAV